MNLVDSSAWLAYFIEEPNAKYFAKVVENVDDLLVPTIVLYEVFKRISHTFGEKIAEAYTGHMRQGNVIDLDDQIAFNAAQLSLKFKLGMADSIILATARTCSATLWTQDADFKGLEGVNYFKK